MADTMRYPVAGDRPVWFTQAGSTVTVVDSIGSPVPADSGFIRFTFEHDGPVSSALTGDANG